MPSSSVALAEAAAGRPRVLIIEPDDRLRFTLDTLLTGAGFEVEATADPLEGLASAKHPEVDVALLDLDLPRLSGIELLGELKSRPEPIEVIVVAGAAAIAAGQEAVRRGAYDCLTKPIRNLEPVSASVRRAADRNQLVARNRELERLMTLRSKIECECLLKLDYSTAKKLAVSAFDTSYLQGLLRLAGGNITRAASRAGLDRSNFRRLLKHNNLASTQPAAEEDRDQA